MGDKKQSRQAIERAAQKVADNALPHVRAAFSHADKYTALEGMAFGVIPTMLLKSSYDEARRSQRDNLEDGVHKLEAAIGGLAKVAYKIDSTEAANTITTSASAPKPKVEPPKAEPSAVTAATGVPAALGFGLYPAWLAGAILKWSMTPVCAVAAISGTIWLLCQPQDEEINKVVSAWESASSELAAAGDIPQLMNLSPEVWTDDARDAFDAWINNYQTELTQAKDAAGGESGVAKELGDALTAIDGILATMAIFDAACLSVMIACWIAEAFPLTRPAAMAVKYATAIANALGTGASVGGAAVLLMGFGGNIANISFNGEFTKLDVKNEPGEQYGVDSTKDTFVDLDITWA
ncbi:hypothetical protein SAMN05421678_101416 [Actinopolymorpha cephalotaxi]|uniref:Uncharacterized protein n=1 Tax=Actinopolymorpha cephalotaxi TaxID=504797 RepID=A0A1I2KN71_9ACTN|nr:hypothetical protein [Actinopolymorpha cephalotaxi]NYH84559.1 hypothetical protein [Actinopolymorpha cephalotaxi]SFF68452.1 hypothetical protein SAMN05421678_101416 [Actinopolymorpha cephalotaxi]